MYRIVCLLLIITTSACQGRFMGQDLVDEIYTPTYSIGTTEDVGIAPGNILITTRMDTGASTSSLHANIIEIQKKQTGDRVLFTVKDRQGKEQLLERVVLRWAKIQKKESQKPKKFPVVRMSICIDETLIEDEVVLVSRKNFPYAMLIGGNALAQGNFVVDPTVSHTTQPDCD